MNWATWARLQTMPTRSASPRRWRRAEGIRAAHAVNLKVHVWTFRAENEFLPDDLQDRRARRRRMAISMAKSGAILDRGIDGFFVDFPAVGVRVRDAYISGVQPLHQPLTETSLPGKRLQGR